MRLSEEEKNIIKNTIREYEPEAQVRLFGSRIKDKSRGGDIDLLILSKSLTYKDKLLIRAALKEKLGNRKIDIIITEKPNNAFIRYAYKHSLII